MESELCLPPLFLRRRFLAGKFYLKSKSIRDGETISSISKLVSLCSDHPYWRNKRIPLLVKIHTENCDNNVYTSLKPEMFSLSTWMINIDIKSCICLDIEKVDRLKRALHSLFILANTIKFLNKNYKNYYKIYTDGSKSSNGVGASFYDPQTNLKAYFTLNRKHSIMSAELHAISESLSYIKTCSYSNYVILCDSRSALQHLARCSSSLRGLPIAYVIIDALLELQSNDVNVKFQWVPSHIGLTGNEQADEVAQLGAHSGIVVQQLPFFTDLLPDLKNNCHSLWKTHFDERSMEKGIWYRTLCNEPPKIPWFIATKADRQKLATLMRLRSGHVPLNAFGYMMKVSDSPDCSLCHKREDVYHALVECVRVESERRRFEADAGVVLTQLGCVSAILAQPKDPVSWGVVNLYLSFIKCRSD